MNIKPILIGRLNKLDEGIYTITGHLGDVENLTAKEYYILKNMNGFNTFHNIAEKMNCSLEEINSVYKKFLGNRKLTDLYNWNKVGWCENCKVHAAGDICGICERTLKKIEFSPPCDPFLSFNVERKFILRVLEKKLGIKLNKNTLFLINNGMENNCFFWEVEYCGKIILKILFKGNNENTWEYLLLEDDKNFFEKQSNVLNEYTIKKYIKANEVRIKSLISKEIAFIRECVNFYKTKPLIYFSGGKESMVMFSLFDNFKIPANVLTVHTGVEFPEDIDFVNYIRKKIEKNKNFNYYYFSEDGKRIIDYLNKNKILSAKNPWCRLNFKKELKNIGTKEIYKGNDFIACEGSRWYENDFRRRHTKINFINDYQHQVWIHPLAEWTSFDIWMYIFSNNLPINPMYFKGFQRTTCWLCPIVNPFHLKCSKNTYPELWNKINMCKLEAFGDDTTNDLPF